MTHHDPKFDTYRLNDRYDSSTGRVFLTGTQALVRIMLDQARRDRDAGLNTAGFISGYRGSPLGAVDQELWRIGDRLATDRIEFMPAVNEDLGATAVMGAQKASLDADCQVEGVFSMWYGKGPGVDRSGDALKHGNAYGSAPKGGVLVVAGDDHGCVSSSMPHQSDVAFMAWFMPVLNPSTIREYLEFGEYGFALSRFSGTWVGFKAISETVEAGQSLELPADRLFVQPDFTGPPGGLHVRLSDLPSPEIETRIEHKLRAVEAFAEANPIDRRIYDLPGARFGIVTTGKAYLDTLEALRLLGLDEAACRRLGIDIYKVGMVWPLARRDALAFVTGKEEVLVIEEKRGIIESQFKEYFYDWPGAKPKKMVGKHRAAGEPLLPWTGEMTPLMLVPVLAGRLHGFFPAEGLDRRAAQLAEAPAPVLHVPGATRTPYFCSGCPHNTSTRLPQGSMAASGIGCHVMAGWMDRDTVGFAQMGGEGVTQAVAQHWNGGKHMFQNLGDGTWYHSGSLAIRQAVAARANLTYKILYNDAVAMTGGQPVDGPVSVAGIAQACRAEGVARIALVSDNPRKFDMGYFPPGTTLHDRSELDSVQRELREVAGVSVLIYEQTCATEKRRRRKRGKMDDPPKFALINELICEGCGDCSIESNCLSVEPVETPFGRKRRINLSGCNKDFSCLNGFCPSFVTIEGGRRRKPEPAGLDLQALRAGLPNPDMADLSQPFDLLVAGVGGTGVVTISALITMAAHLEGKGSSVLDFTGFAQKFGTVLGYVRIGLTPGAIHQVRIEHGHADAVIGCDAVVCSSPKASIHYRPGTQVVLNRAAMPTGDLVLHRDADLRIAAREALIRQTVGDASVTGFDANRVAERLMGDAVFANMMLLGAAFQRGMVPVSELALKQAVLLNGVAVDSNAKAFDLGRVMAAKPEALAPWLADKPASAPSLDELIDQRAAFLTDYQNAAYARRFTNRIARLRAVLPEDAVTAAAKSLFRLMACKDEYEVARLYADPGFADSVARQFEGDYRIAYHLAPPLLPSRRDARGRPVKRRFGPWMRRGMKLLAWMRHLRGTRWDIFAGTVDRRLDRDLLVWFEAVLDHVEQGAATLDPASVMTLLSAPMEIRGYGPVRHKAADRVRKEVARIASASVSSRR
ncbi:indolepyruvate ferredoxin oxidoreductase family protein [Paracoccus sp. (in: a-proteobacteria)]|uniref:indolepyruvate ferredoxin oxidoreductase family protein n=1 Tax=Paracoccus sp. TaxID=267 RepID=UPI003A8AC0D9